MELKIVGAVFLAVSGAIWGINRSICYRQAVGLCGAILEMIRKTEVLIRYSGCDVYEIVRELSTYAEMNGLGLSAAENGGDINSAACEFVEKSDIPTKEKKILLGYWRELGTTDCEGQVKILGGLHETASQLLEVRKAEYAKYGKLYRSVGVLLGLMAGIAVI